MDIVNMEAILSDNGVAYPSLVSDTYVQNC